MPASHPRAHIPDPLFSDPALEQRWRQRFSAAVATVRADGWPVLGPASRWRLGEVTVAWPPPAELVEPPG